MFMLFYSSGMATLTALIFSLVLLYISFINEYSEERLLLIAEFNFLWETKLGNTPLSHILKVVQDNWQNVRLIYPL